MTVDPTLSPVDDPSDPIRRGPTKRRPIPWDERPEAPDHFAPITFKPRCRDRVGYARRRHEWDGDGRCYWCGRKRPGYEP